MTENVIPINIAIADRTYRLKVDASDEGVLRKTVQMINEKIVEFKTNFAGKDMQDYISMVLIWLATEQTKSAEHIVDIQYAIERLATMQTSINKILESNTLE